MATESEPMIPPPSSSPNNDASTQKGKITWIPLAILSGACAAINGVFAKLTTTELTSSWASAISTSLSLSSTNKVVEFLIRALFFSLNLAFNAIMWSLFTTALTRASSTTRVSIINTSANFVLTAFSGWIVFGESLPGLWWVGAAGLVVGNVVIGRRDEEREELGVKGAVTEGGEEGDGREVYRDADEEDVDGISDGVEMLGERGKGEVDVQR
ncbi:hypothetical protein ACLMJK_003553 [Lecanora helva]